MNKYEVMVKIEEIKRLTSVRQFEGALRILRMLDERFIKKSEDIMIFIEIYMQTQMYEQAKELLIIVYKKNPTRRILSKLIYVSIKLNEIDNAEFYYDEYTKIAPNDVNRYIFRYKIDKAKGMDYDTLIESLEELKKYDYIEEWVYELAKNYHRAGYISKCIKECSDIILWFGQGVTVEKAKMLRAYHLNNAADNEEIEEDIDDFSATVELNEILKKVRKRLNTSSYDEEQISEYEREFTTNIPEVEEEYARDYDGIGKENNIEKTLEQLYQKEKQKDKFSSKGYDEDIESSYDDEDEIDFISDALKKEMSNSAYTDTESISKAVKSSMKNENTKKYEKALEKELDDSEAEYEDKLKEELKKLKYKEREDLESDIINDSYDYDSDSYDYNIYENIYENEYDNYDYIELNPDIFSNFYDIDYINYNIRKVIYNIHVNILISNIIITGPKSSGKTTLAKMISKQLYDMGYIDDNKIARVSGDVLNRVNLLKKIDKVIDGCIIVQEAEKITEEAFDRLLALIDTCKGRVIVFLETTLDESELFAKNDKLQRHFISSIKMPLYNVDELVGFAHSYATTKEYYINEGADYALKNYFSSILKNKGACELSTVIKVMDSAMESVNRRNQYLAFDVMNRRYRDNRGSNVIEERDIGY